MADAPNRLTRTFTYRQLDGILGALKGTSETPGLAFRPLPMGAVLLPLRSFTKRAAEALAAYAELVQELGERAQEADEDEVEEINSEFRDLQNRTVDIEVTVIDPAVLGDRDDLSLADLELLEHFFQED